MTRAAVDRLVPLFECVPHFYIEDAWISGYLADFRNVRRRSLPGHYITLADRDFASVRSSESARPALSALLAALTNSDDAPRAHAVAAQLSSQLGLSSEWVAEQLAARALHVNCAHLKTSGRELRCLWKRGVTSEQLYVDFLLHTTRAAPKSFQLLVQRHAKRSLGRFAASSDTRRERARFGCLN